MSRATFKNINRAVAAAGINAELVRGHLYFYFIGDDVAHCYETTVYTPRLTAYTVQQWVEFAQEFKRQNEAAT